MVQGQTYATPIAFGPAGRANGKQGLWNMDKLDIAPRFAFAYSPSHDGGLLGKLVGSKANSTSIRGGFGMYYDHFGEGIINSFRAHCSVWPSAATRKRSQSKRCTRPPSCYPPTHPHALFP